MSPSTSEERWRSEGIQVGGIRSARGVFGNWFDKYASHNCLAQLPTSGLHALAGC